MSGKLKEILASGQAPGIDTKTTDDRGVDRAVPRALKQLGNNDVNKMVKESGFSVNHFKRVWGL
jgi:hypothetical protein